MLRFILDSLILLVLVGAVAFGCLQMGVFSVAATEPDSWLLNKALTAVRDRSIAQGAKNVPALVSEIPEEGSLAGAGMYHAMCVSCHGAPGFKASVVGMGLNPAPPVLSDVVPGRNSDELYWIVANGIRMSGMPAFEPTHSPEELVEIVAFLKRLPGMSQEEYRRFVEESDDGDGDGDGHQHDHGTGHSDPRERDGPGPTGPEA